MTETGYGRGWREPKARSPIARLIQMGNEPATTTTYVVCGALIVIGVFMIVAFLPLLPS